MRFKKGVKSESKEKRQYKGYVTCGPLPRRAMVNLIQKGVNVCFNLHDTVDDHDDVDDHDGVDDHDDDYHDDPIIMIRKETKWSPAAKNSSGVITPVS